MKNYQKYFYNDCIIALQRNQRPFIHAGDITCPFCLANEESLDKIITEKWQVDELMIRIVSNLYPITSKEEARGIHDVIIDTAHHTCHPKDFTQNHWEILLEEMQNRWRMLMKDPNLHFIQIFKNYGVQAGASISHSHWQLIALEKIPYSVKKKYEVYGQDHKPCYLCEKEHQQEGYMVHEDDLWEIWVPPIIEFPYEVWVVPKHHYQHYGQLALEEIKRLGKHIKHLLEAYHQLESHYAFNICMMSGDLKGRYSYHFYIKLMIRRGHVAGFEIATGCHIVSVAPKQYAERIKTILKGMYK